MKKYNIGLSLCMLMLMAIVFIPNTVDARKTSTGNSDAKANEACENAIYHKKFFTTRQDSNNYFVKVNAKEGIWTVKYYYGNADEFDDSNVQAATPNGTIELKGGGAGVEFAVSKTTENIKLVVIAEMQGDTASNPPRAYTKDGKILEVSYKDGKEEKKTTCRPGSVSVKPPFAITGTGAVLTKTIEPKSSKELKGLDEDAQKECNAMNGAYYTVDDMDKHKDPYLNDTDKAGYIAQMKESFPYCFDGNKFYATFDLTADAIKKIRQSSLEAYKAYAEFLRTAADNKAYEDAEKEINDTSLNYEFLEYSNKDNGMTKKTLSCDKDQLTEKTKRYYTRHTEVEASNDNACSVVCQEQIQITYDPPVATKAGLCFQYKVTVKSKVTCKTSLEPDKIKWPMPPSTCSYSPICSNNEKETQAGPNEEFDSCINSCDGGKYTQKCINSCYKKVYGKNSKSNVKKTDTTANIVPKVERLANSDPYKSNKSCDTNSEILSNIGDCVKFFYKTKQEYPMGSYAKASKDSADWIDYEWKKDSSVAASKYKNGLKPNDTDGVALENVIEAIKRSAPYYFRSLSATRKTIMSFYGRENGKNGYGTQRKYIIDNQGLKRQYTSTFQCPETCGFILDSDSKSNCKNTVKEVVKHYTTNGFDKIKSQVENCTTVAKCKDSKEDENTFQISADNSAMKDAVRKESQFEGKNYTTSDGQCINPSGNIKMFIPLNQNNSKETQGFAGKSLYDLENVVDGQTSYECNINPNGINGKCYGKDNPNYWQHYKTTITYPGTWINLKTAENRYVDDNLDKNAVREEKNKYCTGYDFEPVNEQWWNWKVSPPYCDGNTGIPEDMTKLDTLTDKIDYNISAKIIKFGKYNWNIDLNCFYGLSNTVCLPPPVCEDPCECDNSTELCNATFRPITSSKLFPGKNGENREPGFNWTSDATDKSISAAVNQATGYGIDPGQYAKELQEKAQSNDEVNFNGTADYYIHLTKEKIKELRSYSKANGYTAFGFDKNSLKTPAGTYTPVEGVKGLYYYNSKILDGFGSNIERNVKAGVNNN